MLNPVKRRGPLVVRGVVALGLLASTAVLGGCVYDPYTGTTPYNDSFDNGPSSTYNRPYYNDYSYNYSYTHPYPYSYGYGYTYEDPY